MLENGNLKTLCSNCIFSEAKEKFRAEGGRKKTNKWYAQIQSKCFPSVHNNRSEADLRTEIEYRHPVLTLMNPNLLLRDDNVIVLRKHFYIPILYKHITIL